jgi:three-Cys-motif partner protein
MKRKTKQMNIHQFGGDWTEEKLERVRAYLEQYMKIFKKNPSAAYFSTIYVDAFAGSGFRSAGSTTGNQTDSLFPELAETEVQEFFKGSARKALELKHPFDKYVFVEKSRERFEDLLALKDEFPQLKGRVNIVRGDCNEELKRLCLETDWRRHRAVVFLDPYGMQVEWDLIKLIGKTQAIDLWLLFPLGVAVNRMLTRREKPKKIWADSLTRFFGTSDWEGVFYKTECVEDLFGASTSVEVKDADFRKIGQYFVDRLKTAFADVVDTPLPLMNSKNVPLFLLCFAVGNPKAAPTAKKIASHLLKN